MATEDKLVREKCIITFSHFTVRKVTYRRGDHERATDLGLGRPPGEVPRGDRDGLFFSTALDGTGNRKRTSAHIMASVPFYFFAVPRHY